MSNNNFMDWLRENPAPDLQELVREHGGYSQIPPAAWLEWDQQVADWHMRRRQRFFEQPGKRECARPDPAASELREPLRRRQP